MSPQGSPPKAAWNGARFDAGSTSGHYESWFERANHPSRPLAFWIRYTIFRPAEGAAAGMPAAGELWAIWFDGEANRIVAVKETAPLANCRFAASGIDVSIGGSVLDDSHLDGRAAKGPHTIEWSLEYEGNEPPLLLMPRGLYARPFPKAKALVGTPNAVFHGRLVVDGETIEVGGWRGSQNHNWGSRHTDSYAWGQVAGFDNDADAFLECSTAQIRVGPFWTPRMSLVVLRTDGEEVALNSLGQALRARGRCDGFDWNIESKTPEVSVRVHVHAPPFAFVGLAYGNPPGGTKTCLNTKLAACEVALERRGQPPRILATRSRAAFEILTDRRDHGIEVVA